MNRTLLALSGLVIFGICLTACNGGGSSTPNNTPPVSGLTKRVFISNSVAGNVRLVDASTDQFSSKAISLNGLPRRMALALDASLTLVGNSNSGPSRVINIIDNATELNVGGILVPDITDSFVAQSKSTGFASVRNAGVVEVLDLTNAKLSGAITIATPMQIVLSNDGKKLLVFSDTLFDTVTVVDTATAVTTPASAATAVVSASFDHPVSAVFSPDNSKAYILSCGAECGGTAASVTVLDMTTTPPTPGTSVAVPGATVGLLSSSSLFVAGNSSPLPGTGVLTVVDTAGLTAGAPVAVGDGLHRDMGLDNHGHLFIGAKTCTQLRCLTIYDTAAHTATVEVDPDPTHNGNGFGDVGGIQPISGRDRLYLAQGGELRIFDTTTAQPLPQAQQLDVVGYVEDVVQVDP